MLNGSAVTKFSIYSMLSSRKDGAKSGDLSMLKAKIPQFGW